jgi:hypothetical protein
MCQNIIAGNVLALPKCRNRIPAAWQRRRFFSRRLDKVKQNYKSWDDILSPGILANAMLCAVQL